MKPLAHPLDRLAKTSGSNKRRVSVRTSDLRHALDTLQGNVVVLARDPWVAMAYAASAAMAGGIVGHFWR